MMVRGGRYYLVPPDLSAAALSAPVLFRVKRRRGTAGRPWALRKSQDYTVERSGDLVQLDTLDLRPSPGVVLKQFTARDLISRWDVIEVHRRATSRAATLFLDTLQRRLPFPLPALQVDGSSEFAALFEEACRERGLRLFVLLLRSPKLNGQALPIFELNRELESWERPTTPSVPTKPWVTSLPRSSWPNPYLLERNSSVSLIYYSSCALPV